MTVTVKRLQSLERRVLALEKKLAAQSESMAAFVAQDNDTIRISRAVAEEWFRRAVEQRYPDDGDLLSEINRALTEQKGGSK